MLGSAASQPRVSLRQRRLGARQSPERRLGRLSQRKPGVRQSREKRSASQRQNKLSLSLSRRKNVALSGAKNPVNARNLDWKFEGRPTHFSQLMNFAITIASGGADWADEKRT
jgi:hypothetical protein